jgi:predicted amino acid dehydrogenase
VGTLDWIKEGVELAKKANRLDLAAEMLEQQAENLELKKQILELKEENEELKKQMELDSNVTFDKGICWLHDDSKTDMVDPTPICPKCWQFDKIVNRLPIESYQGGRGIQCRKREHGIFMFR